MKVYKSIKPLVNKVGLIKKSNKSIGLVPTMGFLHEGHMSLIRRARKDNDIVTVSIFVNPIQFDPKEDFKRYPRDMDRDIECCKRIGVDIVFVPTTKLMYNNGYSTYVNIENLTDGLCGRSRPGHFKGVTTVVAKLLNIVSPDTAYFGQKDAQQAIVIKRMVHDLRIPVRIKTMPIVREKDGLAMSSRNIYLSPRERKEALSIQRSLRLAKGLYKDGERSAKKIIDRMRSVMLHETHAKIDYISIVDLKTLKDVDRISDKVLVAVAAWIGKIRLIDNVVL